VLDLFIDLVDAVEGVHLEQLPPLTTLLVWTWNSQYQLVVREGSHVYVQGGTFFPDPTSAHVDGASLGGSLLKMGWIGVGFVMEFRVGASRIMTSPVLAIATERLDNQLVH
jgi:hypothetical protein